MEDVLSKLVQHSVNYAIRSGIAITTGYAINAGSRLLKSVKGTEKDEIADLQARLRSKISIISPSIDMIELIAARGNTTLDTALVLTNQLRVDIQDLGVRLNQAATDEEKIRRKSTTAKSSEQMSLELKQIIAQMKRLLARIEDAVPLLMLAITTSGASLSTTLPASVSPSRLLQASTFLSAADASYASMPGRPVQVGPDFVLSLYMLFAAHTQRPQDEDGITETTWKEVVRKARVKLLRVPLSKLYDFPSTSGESSKASHNPLNYPAASLADQFGYQIMIVEDLDDDRYHEDEGESFEGILRAGIREVIPIHEISRIFYADTGKILKIGSEGEPNNPILLIRRDNKAIEPRRMARVRGEDLEEDSNHVIAREQRPINSKGFPPDLDTEWLALEVYTDAVDTDDEELEADSDDRLASSPPSAGLTRSEFLTNALSGLRLRGSTPSEVGETSSPRGQDDLNSSQMTHVSNQRETSTSNIFATSRIPPIRSSLSLLELLIRLTALQQFQQASHLAINDEFLNFFLSGSSSTGAGADSEYRKRVRRDARLRVGFDPYDESPIKPRGEDYIRRNGRRLNAYDEGVDDEEEDWRGWEAKGEMSSSMTGLNSSPSIDTPLSHLRRTMQQRLGRPGGQTRSQQLRDDLGGYARSPLGRSDSDSTLGTSPRTPALDEDRKSLL